MNPFGRTPSIMAVDDEPHNLKLLEEMLRQKGYEVRSFPRGRLALAAAAHQTPDLILLDISMPELSGYEVCERLKSDSRLAGIPVVFLSALRETEDKVRGFRVGGVDYVSKPFQFDEVYARVETHIKLHDLQRALKRQNETLEEKVALRTRELAAAHARLTRLDGAKDDFLKIISHEFRTPLHGLLGVGDIVFEDLPQSAGTNELRHVYERSRERILSLLDDAMLLTQIDVNGERFGSAPVSWTTALKRAMERTNDFAQSRHVTLELAESDMTLVRGDEDLLVSAWRALLETAIKFSEEGGTVRIVREAGPGSPKISIESHGRTIPSGAVAKFFDVFSISEAMTPGGDLGLGPPLACRILSLFGGAVTVANIEPSGIRLTVSF